MDEKGTKKQTKLPTDHPVYRPNTLPPRLAQSTLKAVEANCLLALDTCRSETGSSPRPEPSADHWMTHPNDKRLWASNGKASFWRTWRLLLRKGTTSMAEPSGHFVLHLLHLDFSSKWPWASEGHSTYSNCQDAKTWPSSNSSGPEPWARLWWHGTSSEIIVVNQKLAVQLFWSVGKT